MSAVDRACGYYVSQIPATRVVVMPCGHENPQEVPADTAALVTAFLAQLQ